MILLEREAFLAGLDFALAEASAGAGSIALVSGEAGIGKSSLVEAFTRYHQNALRVLRGACDSLFAPQPLGPLYDMSIQIQGKLPELLNSDANRGLIFSTLLFELQKRTTIAVFEDVHWADEATLDLLRFIGRRIAQTRSLLVLTYRDDELGPRHPLRILLGDLAASSAVHRFSLPPLTEMAVSALIAGRSLDAAALYRQTEGNPFFVTEVLASSGSGIPATVRDAVLARAARLSPAGYAVLEAAAVIGQRIEPWLLAELVGSQAHAVDECMAGGMLLTQGSGLSFRHELARQTILEMISPPRRRSLHQQVLDLLVSSPVAHSDLAHLAHHAEAAGNHRAVLQYAPAAARQASAASAHRTAAALYSLALRYAGDLTAPEHARLLQLFALECGSIDNRVLGIQILRQALQIWRELQDTLKQGEVLAQMGNVLIGLGQDSEARQCTREAIEILESHPPSQELASAYRVQASLDMIHRNLTESVAWAEKSIVLAERLADTTEYYSAQTMLGSALLYLDYERACRHMEGLLAPADAAGRKTVVALIYANLGSGSSELYQFLKAEQYLKAGLAYTAKHDLDRLRYYMLAWLAFTQLRLCQWDAAAESAGIVLRDANLSVTSRLTALVTLGRLRARLGDPQANTLLDEAQELSRNMGSIERLGLISAARAEAAWLAGDLDRARVEACAAYDLALAKEHPWFTGELAFWRRRAGEALAVPGWIARPYALHLSGDWSGAAGEWERMGCLYEQAEALADGDVKAQIAALNIFERLGARPAAEALRQKLQAVGVFSLPPKPRASTRENPFGLTPRQVEILALLTEGLSNSEIAARLSISPKTADHHVSAILARLDVHTREAAAALARQHPHFKEK